MRLYDLYFSVGYTIEADDEIKALEIFADYIKDMRFGEICDNTEVREAKDNEEKQDE